MLLLQRGGIGVEALWRAVFSPDQRNPEFASQALQRCSILEVRWRKKLEKVAAGT